MKQNKLLKPLLAVLLLALLPQAAAAYDFMVGGLCYNRNSDGTSVTVTYQKSTQYSPFYSNLSGNLVIPATVTYSGTTYSVTSIGSWAFAWCSGLTSVTIPNSVTSIGSDAFNKCSGLTSVTIPNSVTSIGSCAFFYCSGLTSVTIPNSITSIGSQAFYNCSGLTSVTIPNSVTSIGSDAFYGCRGLTSVTIPNSVTSIGSRAFKGCRGLTSVTIGNSVTSIGSEAFYGCSGLTEVTIPNSVTSIGSEAFRDCSGLTSVTIPNSVTSIGSDAFRGCSGLTSVTIGNSVTSIGARAFQGCSGIKELTWNAINCSSMGDMPTGSIEQVTIGDGVEVLPGGFVSGSKITTVTIPNSVTSIGSNAFYECSGIKELTWNAINCSSMGDMPTGNIEQVTIGDGVEVLPGGFVSGSKITSVTIPNSVTSIGSSAFADCSGLLLVCSKIVEPEGVQLGDNVFAGIPFTTCKLNVPSGTIASYQSADQWKDFLMIVDFSYDVNLDGTIDIADVNAVVNKMLERNGAPTKELADVNRDDYVDIIDVNEVISAMLGYGNLPEPPCATQTYTVNGVSFTMIGVQGGTFTMGATAEQGSDAFDSEKPAHQVTLSNYRIGQTEVTQELWQAVMGSNPSRFTGDLQRPVERVSWDDCQTFITKLNQLTGKNFRLPTEAEWEYAARGGNQSQGYKYAGSNNVDEVAWHSGNSSTTHTVATKAPNELGIYDMSGNVLEWCQDWYGSYSSDAQTNPTGPTSGSRRTFRGGSYSHTNIGCNRVSWRYADDPTKRYINLGFRLALLPEPPISTQTYTVNGVTFSMIGVNGGTFTMGATAEQGSDAYSDEKPAHQVTLSNYRIGQTEVTQELWQAVMGSNPSHFTGDLQRPVECVSWKDCQTFISKLNQLTGKYFRLPTEAEWEYAARGGNQSQGYKYAGSNNVNDVAWYYVNSGSTTHTVATKAPNELGLYDMSGNVDEWCQDWWSGSYSSDAQTNPTGPASGSNRVYRGGSWGSGARSCRVAFRYNHTSSSTNNDLGLRLAL